MTLILSIVFSLEEKANIGLFDFTPAIFNCSPEI